ncbi:MAG TPA: septum formation initiator family protein [Candidatus Mediterraneibacter quadrami]|uniref:Septum formation initiator family protein n=1 Tax=Candidatus Mediterraneibacter quadrami TaxID=2838684 RepID=A0A9D2U7Y9_9FIRM|nr:septum formation initiator family protein [Candidatus Mediterraneibacter quadrami]
MKKGRHPGLDARWGRRNRKLSRYRRSILMICAVLVCMTVMLAVGSMRLQAKNAQYKAQEAELQEQIREQEDRAKEIDEFEEYVKTDDYIKEMAEDRLNLVDPNEIVFKPSE